MKFFFDNNLSRHLAHGVRELSAISSEVESVIHLTDRFPRDVADLTWISDLTNDGPWSIISIDRFRKQRGAEQEAIRRSGHIVFILDRQWSAQGFWPQSERLIKWWPHIISHSARVHGGVYRIPWHYGNIINL